jgi:hypothetical protein
MDFDRLPEETIEKFLLLCPSDCLPDFTLVSKRFNQVIGNSSRLMKNFEVCWEDRDGETKFPLMDSKRKYRNLDINNDSSRLLLPHFIKNNATTLTLISFSKCFMTSTELKNLLKLVAGNIESLAFYNVNLKLDSSVESVETPKLNNLIIMHGDSNGDGYGCVIPFFKGAKLTRFCYEDEMELNDKTARKFADFLSTQENLLDLGLSGNIACMLFNENQPSAWFNVMKLTKLYMALRNASQSSKQRFSQFLTQQKASLKTLTLLHVVVTKDLMETILQLNLETLRLVHFDFENSRSINEVNNSIKTLSFSSFGKKYVIERQVCNLMKACTAVNEILLRNSEITFEMSVTMARDVDLQTLDLRNCTLMPITYPRLKKLLVHQCNITETVRLIRVNYNLEKIKVSTYFSFSGAFHDAIQETAPNHVEYF